MPAAEGDTSAPHVGARCAAHPARPALDSCPVCGRSRCAADAQHYAGHGCPACASAPREQPQTSATEAVIRAGLAALTVAFVGGWIAAEYVDTAYFATIAPGLVGLACAWIAAAVVPRSWLRLALAVATVAALLATGLSDRLVPGGQNLFLPPGHRLPPYAGAVVGVLAWRLLFGPVDRRRDGQPARGTRK